MSKHYLLRKVCIFVTFLCLFQNAKAISYTWNGSVSNDFGTPTNWTPAGVPGTIDDIIINSSGFSPLFEELAGVRNFTINSGTFNVNGFIFLIRGTSNFNGGTVTNGSIQFVNSGAVTFGNCTISTTLTGNASAHLFNGATFNQPVTLIRTGTGTSTSNGGNTFNGNFQLTNNSGTIVMNNLAADVYNGNATFTSNSINQINIAHTSGTTIFNGQVFLNSLSTGTIQFGINGGQSRISSGFAIQNGTSGINSGTINIRNLQQLGSATNTITASNTTTVNLQAGCNFGGQLTITSGNSTIQSSTFGSHLTVNKNSNANNTWTGGNSIVGNFRLNHNGTGGNIILGSTTADVFNGTCELSLTGNGTIDIAQGSTNNIFNGSIILSSTATSINSGIRFCQLNGSATWANSALLSLGASGFSTGVIRLRNITQSSTSAINLIQTSGSAQFYFESGSTFAAPITINFPRFFLNGSTFNNQTSFSKNGALNDFSNGGNTFNGNIIFRNNSNASIYLANTNSDVFNAQTSFLDGIGSGIIFPSHTAVNNVFNGNILVGSTSVGGVHFGQNGGTTSLTAGNTIAIDASGMSAGELRLRNFTQLGSSFEVSLQMTFGSAALRIENNCIFNAPVNILFPQIFANNSTFNNTTTLIKNGGTENISAGGNTFNGVTRISTTSANIQLGNTNPDIFNNDVYFINSAGGLIGVARTSIGNQFNGDIYISSTSGNGIQFCQNGGSATQAVGKRIINGIEGITNGSIIFRSFTQLGNLNNTITGTNVSQLRIQQNCQFNGDLNLSFPSLFVTQSVFNGNVAITKTFNVDNLSNGGNTFNGNLTLRNTSTNVLGFGNSLADIFNQNVILENQSSGALEIARTSLNNQFNGNITLNGTGTGNILFGNNNGSANITGGSITLTNANCRATTLRFRNVTQTGGAPVNLSNSATQNVRLDLVNSSFSGNVTAIYPSIFSAQTTFGGTVWFEKTGNFSTNFSNGGNTFNDNVTIRNISTAAIGFGSTLADVYNQAVNLETTLGGGIELARVSSNNVFNGNININSAGSGNILIGGTSGSATLNSSGTIALVGSNCLAGTVRFRNLTQTGNAAISLINNTASSVFFDLINCSFNGNVTIAYPRLTLSNSTFNGLCNLTKRGAGQDINAGNNQFYGTLRLANEGSNNIVMSNTTRDIYYGNVIVQANGVGGIHFAHSGTNTEFRGNIDIPAFSSNSVGLFFGQNGGTSTLSSGRTVAINPGLFQGAVIRFRNFTQLGNTAQLINNITGSTLVFFESGSQFNGNVTVNAPGILLNGTRFNGLLNLTKTGTSNNDCIGNNIFNGNVNITNNSTGYLRLASVTGGGVDNFNGNVVISNSTINTIDLASRFNSEFSGNISNTGTNANCSFGVNGGILTLIGNNVQNIQSHASFPMLMNRLRLNKTDGRAVLSNPLTIGIALQFIVGNIQSSASSLLVMNNASTVSGVSNSGFVDGPIRKIGNQAFTFPIGKNGNYRPIAISAPTTNTHHFTAEYFLQTPGNFYNANSKDASIDHISQNEFWILDRTNGTSAVSVTLSWNELISGQVTNLSKLRICRWDGSAWRNHGNGATNGNTIAGNISSSGTINSFSPFTLGSIDSENPLPIELIYFNAVLSGNNAMLEWSTASENNNHYFEVEKSYDLIHFETIAEQSGTGNSNQILKYNHLDLQLKSGITYYRLKQNDFDGSFTYSDIQSVQYESNDIFTWNVYPNPVVDLVTIAGEQLNNTKGLIQLFDAKGAMVFQENLTTNLGVFQIDLSNLPEGVYFLTLKTDRFTSQKTINKIK